jgi:hypothetical protein
MSRENRTLDYWLYFADWRGFASRAEGQTLDKMLRCFK